MEKILTITIPSYNVEQYLEETLCSFLHSDIMDKIEILVVNDGSKDRTLEIAREYELKYPGIITAIDKENGGHGSTINTGIKNAKGKYFKVVDGDDWVDTNAFSRFVKKLADYDTDLVISPFNTVDDQTKAVKAVIDFDFLKGKEAFSLDLLVELAKQRKYRMHALTFKTEALRNIKPISEHCFYVDQEYICYPLQYISSICYIGEPIYQYRVGNTSQSMAIKNMQKNRAMHLHVIEQLISLYNSHLTGTAKEIVKYQLMGLIETQTQIYCSMPKSKQIEKETISFVHMIQTTVPDLCRIIPGKKCFLLIRSNGKLYWLVSSLYQHKLE